MHKLIPTYLPRLIRYLVKILSPLAISVVIKIYVVTHNQVIHYLYGLIIVYAKFGCIATFSAYIE